jgi:hypothetical protein
MFRSNLSRSNQSWIGLISCLAMALCFCTSAAAREKVDVVYLKNGDRITGEIISLEYGELRMSTDSMAKVAIEWPDVVRVVSAQNFVVEDDVGGRFHGSLVDKSPRDKLSVQISPDDAPAIELAHVTRIAPTEETFFKRLEGSFSVGFDYAKASEITTLGGAANFAYRAPTFGWALDLDTNSTKDPQQGTLDRSNAGFHYQWYRSNRRFWSGLASLERNEETGIDARLLVGGGIGRYFYQTARAEVSGIVGLVGLDEWATGSVGSQQSIEAVIGGTWRIFRFNTPKVSLNTTTLIYHSLTESSRDRAKVNFSLRQEVISDFFVDVSVYYSYDSEPPDVTAEKDDYGVTTSLGYSFN